MTVRSTQLARVHVTTVTNTLLYTCPTGWRTIVKDVHGDNAGGVSGSINLTVSNSDGSITQYFVISSQPANAPFQWQGWMVLNPGDRVIMYSAAIPTTIWLSGTLLQLTGQEPM